MPILWTISAILQQPIKSLCTRSSLISAQCSHAWLMLQCQVFDLLLAAQGGIEVELPDPMAILPYIGLFSLVVLKPSDLTVRELLTTHLLGLSILHNSHSIPTPNTSPTAPNVARIFDVLTVINAKPLKQWGHIPLSPRDPKFEQQRYWQLPARIGVILAMLVKQVPLTWGCAEVVAT